MILQKASGKLYCQLKHSSFVVRLFALESSEAACVQSSRSTCSVVELDSPGRFELLLHNKAEQREFKSAQVTFSGPSRSVLIQSALGSGGSQLNLASAESTVSE